MLFLKACKCISLAIVSLPLGLCAVAVGLVFASLIKTEGLSPDLAGVLFIRAMLGFGLVETFALFALIIAGVIFVM